MKNNSLQLHQAKTFEDQRVGFCRQKNKMCPFPPRFQSHPTTECHVRSMSGGPLQGLVKIRGGPRTAYRLSQPGEVHPKCPLDVLL